MSIQIDDCWNRIGIRGDCTCPKLQDYFRCLNCPTYAAGASALLDRPVSAADMISDWGQAAQSLARSETAVSALIFRAGNEWLALPTDAIVEVAEQRTIHSLPHQTNRAILGLSNIRGSLLLCVSLTQMLGAERASAAAIQRLLVVGYQGQTLVFPVDEVLGVQRFTQAELQTVPSTVAQSHTTYTQAMIVSKDKKIGLLDCNLLFYALNRSLT
ncbi:chemotaxis protein CheW [Herminiimonas sp. KBW02]|nr:chemotaxis protein CheW [Herminiimonas sp. KBW02]